MNWKIEQATDQPAPLPPLHLPEGLGYECVQCGRSCGEFLEIPVDPETAAALGALCAAGLAPSTPQLPVVESPWSPGQLIMRQENGRCCLQRADGLCTVHADCGFAAKPAICRSFPYKFIETPAGVHVGLSFACTAVLGNQGPPVATAVPSDALRDAWLARSGHSHRRLVADPLLLTEYLPLSWEQYQRIEEDLSALLDPALGPLGQRLVMQSVYLRLLINFLREAREQAGTRLEGPAAHDQPLGVFRLRLRQPGSELFARLQRMAGRRAGSPMLRRMVLGFAHVLRTTYTQRRGRLASYFLATSQYLLFAAGRGVVELPGLPPVPWARLAAVGFDPARPEFDELLTRYFRHRLFRKDLAVADTVQTAHAMHLMHWGLIHWYGAARAAAAGSPRVELEHLSEAVRFVESHCVFHSSFDKMFSHYPMLRGFMDRLFLKPHYAFAMGWGEWVK